MERRYAGRLLPLVLAFLLSPGPMLAQPQRVGDPENGETREQSLANASQAIREASLLSDQGKFGEALPILEKALETRRRLLGGKAIDTLAVQEAIAGLVRLVGRLCASRDNLSADLGRLCRMVQGPKHPDDAASLAKLALLRYSLADYAGAEPPLGSPCHCPGIPGRRIPTISPI